MRDAETNDLTYWYKELPYPRLNKEARIINEKVLLLCRGNTGRGDQVSALYGKSRNDNRSRGENA